METKNGEKERTTTRNMVLVFDTLNMNTTLNVNDLMKVRNIKCKLKHKISTMVICGSYMHKNLMLVKIRKNK